MYSYSYSDCIGNVVAVVAYPVGSCIPQYSGSSIVSYLSYSCGTGKTSC
jgi:hypothetical protein